MPTQTEKKRLPRGQGRERILAAATELFLKDGFEATSPQAIYAESGVGQGSFYHHFSGKDDLANKVLQRLVEKKVAELEAISVMSNNPKERLEAYFKLPRDGLKGCTFGRFMYENSAGKVELSHPIKTFFEQLECFLRNNMSAAQEQMLIPKLASPDDLARLLMAQIQGGYILSRIYQDDGQQARCIASLASLLGLSLD